MSTKTHPLSVTHLVVGLVFLGIAGSWALRQVGLIEVDDMGWLFPLALVVAGGVGLVAAMAKGVRGRKPQPGLEREYVVETPYDQPPRPDYTSDLDRKISEAERSQERTTVLTTDAGTDTDTGSTDSTDTTRIDTEENDR
jgi:hypothetical protein